MLCAQKERTQKRMAEKRIAHGGGVMRFVIEERRILAHPLGEKRCILISDEDRCGPPLVGNFMREDRHSPVKDISGRERKPLDHDERGHGDCQDISPSNPVLHFDDIDLRKPVRHEALTVELDDLTHHSQDFRCR